MRRRRREWNPSNGRFLDHLGDDWPLCLPAFEQLNEYLRTASREYIAARLEEVSAALDARELTPQGYAGYFLVLDGFSESGIKGAARRVLETQKYKTLPTPAVFKEFAEDHDKMQTSERAAYLRTLNDAQRTRR